MEKHAKVWPSSDYTCENDTKYDDTKSVFIRRQCDGILQSSKRSEVTLCLHFLALVGINSLDKREALSVFRNW